MHLGPTGQDRELASVTWLHIAFKLLRTVLKREPKRLQLSEAGSGSRQAWETPAVLSAEARPPPLKGPKMEVFVKILCAIRMGDCCSQFHPCAKDARRPQKAARMETPNDANGADKEGLFERAFGHFGLDSEHPEELWPTEFSGHSLCLWDYVSSWLSILLFSFKLEVTNLRY